MIRSDFLRTQRSRCEAEREREREIILLDVPINLLLSISSIDDFVDAGTCRFSCPINGSRSSKMMGTPLS